MIVSETSIHGDEIYTFYAPLILTILSFISAIFMLFAQVKFIRMRIYAGKLLLHTILIQITLDILFSISLFYVADGQASSFQLSQFNFDVWEIDPALGQVFGVIETYVAISYYLYHLCIAHNLYFSTRKYNKGDFKFRFKYYLLLSHGVSLVLTIVAVGAGEIGLQNVGIFGIDMNSNFQYIFLLFLGVILPFSVFSICFSLYQTKRMDTELQSEKLYEKELRHDFVNFNCQLLIVFLITWMPYAFVSFLGLYDPTPCACLTITDQFLNVLKLCSLNLLAWSPFLNGILRLFRPIVRRDLAIIFKCYKASATNKKPLLDKQEGQAIEQEFSVRGHTDISNSKNGSTITSDDERFDPRSTNYTNKGTYIQSTKTVDLSMSEIFVKKKKPKKPLSLPELLDILLVFLNHIKDLKPLEETHDMQWAAYHYTNLKKQELDPNSAFNDEEKNFVLASLQKAITFHTIMCIKYADEIFADFRRLWNIDFQTYQDSFKFKENIEFCVKTYKKRFNHLEKRYFYTSKNKKFLFQVLEKESKLFFIDKFLSEFHPYILTNPCTFLFRPVQLISFTYTSHYHNVLSVLNPYEQFYSDSEDLNCDIPQAIFERYLLDGKYFRYETYDGSPRKIKTPTAEVSDAIFNLNSDCKREVMEQLHKDLGFLDKLGVINYRIVFLVTKNEEAIKKLVGESTQDSGHTRKKFVHNGCVRLESGAVLKIFIDTNLVTSEMKGVEMKRSSPMFSIESSEIYRQLLEEVANGIL